MKSTERSTRLRAGLIRKRFANHSETVQRIVFNMSDEQLIAQEDAHHARKCDAMAAAHRIAFDKKVIVKVKHQD